LNLVPKNFKITAKCHRKRGKISTGEIYLKLIYPQNHSLSLLKRGDMLEGYRLTTPTIMLGRTLSGSAM
jgi:hypothetical protein